MKNIVRKWYEDKKNVDEMRHWNKGKLKIWEQSVVKKFLPQSKILDVGCGMVREAFALTNMGFSVTGIDISTEVINQVTQLSLENGYDIPFIKYDGLTLPFEDASFDVVIIWAQTFGIMHGDTYKNDFMNECKRVLRKDGLLSYSGHDYKYEKEHYEHYTKERKFYPYADADIYWELFSPEELTHYAKNAGFTILLCEKGEIYRPEDGIVLHCLCRTTNDENNQ